MLQPASRVSRASSSSSSSFQPVARQNTMSSHDTRSLRQSKRMSVTALYLSMSAKDRDLEISDDLARGMRFPSLPRLTLLMLICSYSPETPPRTQVQDFLPIQEELRPGERCAIPGFANCIVDSEPNGIGGGKIRRLPAQYRLKNGMIQRLPLFFSSDPFLIPNLFSKTKSQAT